MTHSFAAGPARGGILLAGALLFAVLLVAPSTARAIECPKQPSAVAPSTAQPANIGELKQQVLNYKCFGEYDKDVAKVLDEARAFVDKRAGEVQRPALVLDIDETSLSNWTQLAANDFGYFGDGSCDILPRGPCGQRAWELRAEATAIAPTLALFNAAKSKGVAIIFITGRTGDPVRRAATIANLRAAGYDGWTWLVMRPENNHQSAKDYKTAARQDIESQGYKIIASVGDQQSDLDGGFAERTFKVPNPFYFIP